MKFKTKLYASIGSLLLLFFVIAVILMNMLEQTTVNMNAVVNELNARIKIASELKYETSAIGTQLSSIVYSKGEEDRTKYSNDWEETQISLQIAIESLEKKDAQEKTQELIAKYKVLYQSYLSMGQQAMAIDKLDGGMNLPATYWSDSELVRQRMIQIADLLYGLQEQEMKNELLRSKDSYNWAVTIIYIYLGIALFIGIGFTMWVIRSQTNNLNKVTAVMKSATASGFHSLPRIKISSKGELGEIAVAFNKMAQSLEEQSMLEKQLVNQAEEQSWLNTQVAEIATIYPKVENVQMLADLLITKLVPMVGGASGAFYMKEEEHGKHYLQRVSTYASHNNEKDFARFQFGEGLVGQCASEKRPILLEDVPEDYIKIVSGTGNGSPRNIIILPVLFEQEVLAVMELASFRLYTPLQVKLLETVNHHIGIKINSIASHMKAERLLRESQALTEELQTKSEELQLQQEELRTTNEKLEEQYKASEQKNREIEKVRGALEEKAQQLEQSSQYKSEFLANMSHELRTPLNSLLILAETLSENGAGNFTVKQQEYIRTIHSSGQDLLYLINDVLDLAKVESGKMDINHGEMDLGDVLDSIYRQFSPVASQKEISFTVEMDGNLSAVAFLTDQQRLHQILNNLLSNAFKFTASGSVSLRVEKVWKEKGEGAQGNPMLAFSVTDTGIGIQDDKQDMIFEAFKQADGTTSRNYGGTGLGLSISREIAQLLEGFIEVSSEAGKGSIFTLFLPYRQKIEEFTGPKAIAEVSVSLEETESVILEEEQTSLYDNWILKNKKILIVDDDIRNVYALTIALEKYDMNIIVAENGREGLEVLRENPDTNLILMDIMMPEMDGLEAMRHIRRIPEFTTLPIIALTAKAMKSSREECLASGATDYISKPVKLDQLFSLLQVWLYRKEG